MKCLNFIWNIQEFTTTQMVASREERVGRNSSKRWWVYTPGPDSHGGSCYCWVFTYGPSPINAAFGCLHLDPARLQQPPPSILYQLYNGQISPSTVGVYISTQPSCYLQHHQCGNADQESESFESESLAMVAIYISCNLMLNCQY